MPFSLLPKAGGSLLTFPSRAAARAFQRSAPGQYRSSEYAQRVEPKVAAGLTRGQARGHPPPVVRVVKRRGAAFRADPSVHVAEAPAGRTLNTVEGLAAVRRAFRGVKGPDVMVGVQGRHPTPGQGPAMPRQRGKSPVPPVPGRPVRFDPDTRWYGKVRPLSDVRAILRTAKSTEEVAERLMSWPVRQVTGLQFAQSAE